MDNGERYIAGMTKDPFWDRKIYNELKRNRIAKRSQRTNKKKKIKKKSYFLANYFSLYMIKTLKDLCIQKVLRNDEIYHFSPPKNWPLYCKMKGYIVNVHNNKWFYCSCLCSGKEKSCNICKFYEDLWIFETIKLTYNKNKKIPVLCKKYINLFVYLIIGIV